MYQEVGRADLHGECLVKTLDRLFLDGRKAADPGVRDENIEPAASRVTDVTIMLVPDIKIAYKVTTKWP